MSFSSNYFRRHLVAASCAMGAAATASYTSTSSSKQEDTISNKNHLSAASASPSTTSAMTAASFWVSTLLQDPFVRTTLAEPSDFKVKKKLTKGMTLEEKWEYFTFMAINPGDDDDDDDDDDDEDDEEEDEE
mmetsp:Transcript_30437/g.73001  ORF Transcript_30437/g.73001 Transcript_30437/m.73001 type:complete len:132 (-) Transcript_30437:232-627(-)|eukprot:CAMPEP_0113630724 /NCGR_PEP_ID=MMETSP0017_2-20120614/15966_1 /TAXON_ID=2856 /ORGANISM="Cylindrotheca closterium" /LENGTH=131 /DNA_ID=CAMNT_0000541205 /DNA_START=88 /DNA_END=483 /DNA_ORIENTATION=- /assembly_acc=CAM_ASM_000147